MAPLEPPPQTFTFSPWGIFIMSGFSRGTQPAALDRNSVTTVAAHLIAEEIAAFENASADPFQLAHDCLNPAGHYFAASCGMVACVHCAKVIWL